MSSIQLQTNLKVIKSGNEPTTATLPEGNLAFGVVDGAPKLYGNDGSGVKEYGATGGGGGAPSGPRIPFQFSVNDWESSGSNYQYVLEASTHLLGAEVLNVFVKVRDTVGTPQLLDITVNENFDIVLKSDTTFDGAIILI